MGTQNKPGSQYSLSQRLLSRFLRKVFDLLYHRFAWTYDWVAAIVSAGAWQEWVSACIPYLQGPRILEIGYGPGHLQAELSQRNLQLFGLDESRQMASIARKRLLRAGIQPRLLRGDAFHLPFAGSSFDQVVLTFPAAFILQPAAIDEIRRVLDEQGSAVILPFAWITGRSPLQRAAAWLNRITGEAPDFHASSLDPLKNLGFDLSWEIKDLGSSKILLLRLVKLPV